MLYTLYNIQMLGIIGFSFIIMLASLSGVLFVWKGLGHFIQKNLSFLVSFSAGVFLFVTYLLGKEVFHHAENKGIGVLWIFIGVLIFYGLFKLLPNFHHHHDEGEEGEHAHSHIDARRILLSDGVHNIGDGILLATAFATAPGVGLLTTLSIFIHEFVQEVSEFFVLREAGFQTKKALIYNFLVSATILIGAIGSFLIFDLFEAIEIPLLGIATGSFLVVVINDLIPHSIRHSQNRTQYLKHTTWFIGGLILMGLVGSILGH
jgi:zinc and cadmium transporter